MADGVLRIRLHPIIASCAVAFGTTLTGCSGALSTLDPAGRGAADIAWITWIMIGGTLLLMALMSGLWLHAVHRRRAAPLHWPEKNILIGGGVILPLMVVVLLLVYGVRSGESMLPVGPADLEVRAVGHQWWWAFEYTDANGGTVRIANELHLPVNALVDVHVETTDVIHSFWVPALGGKLDAIPGRTNTLRLQPTRTGRFQGQCAEFCGALHAHMFFDVTVHEAEGFSNWLTDAANAADGDAEADAEADADAEAEADAEADVDTDGSAP